MKTLALGNTTVIGSFGGSLLGWAFWWILINTNPCYVLAARLDGAAPWSLAQLPFTLPGLVLGGLLGAVLGFVVGLGLSALFPGCDDEPTCPHRRARPPRVGPRHLRPALHVGRG